MKKALSISILSATLLSFASLSSCSNKPKVSGPQDTKLCFTEYVQSDDNFAIEIYNFSSEVVDLKWYKLNEYYKAKEDKVTFTLDLKGTLKPGETYVVCSSSSTQEVKNLADFIVEDDSTTGFSSLGTQVFSLTYGDVVVDSLGNLGYKSEWGRDVTLMRREDKWHGVGKNYDYRQWLKYPCNTVGHLGEAMPTVTVSELLEGPRFDENYLDIPYEDQSNPNVGAGGAVKAQTKSTYTIDGDTADFYFYDWDSTVCVTTSSYGSKLDKSQTGYTSWARVRYFNVDTPESAPQTVEPWGLGAKDYMNKLLKAGSENDSIYIQSIKGNNVTGNYGRLLAFVYADSYLTNFMIVKNGLSQAGKLSESYSDGMIYKELPFATYFEHAEYYAEENKLGLYGQQDPFWDYLNNKPKA